MTTTPQEQSTPPAPTPPAPSAPAPVDAPEERFAAYDKTLLRFVGGVHSTRAKATKAAKDKGATSVEIRTV